MGLCKGEILAAVSAILQAGLERNRGIVVELSVFSQVLIFGLVSTQSEALGTTECNLQPFHWTDISDMTPLTLPSLEPAG